MDILVRREDIIDRLKEKKLSFDVVIQDLQKAIDEENPQLSEEEWSELEGRKGEHPLLFPLILYSTFKKLSLHIFFLLFLFLFRVKSFFDFFARFESPKKRMAKGTFRHSVKCHKKSLRKPSPASKINEK